jgi:hypothetical protein
MARVVHVGHRWVRGREAGRVSSRIGLSGVRARIQPISHQNPVDGESLKSNVLILHILSDFAQGKAAKCIVFAPCKRLSGALGLYFKTVGGRETASALYFGHIEDRKTASRKAFSTFHSLIGCISQPDARFTIQIQDVVVYG